MLNLYFDSKHEGVNILCKKLKLGLKLNNHKTKVRNYSIHQLQNIEHIGLLDYFYDEDIFSKSQKEQFDSLKQEILDLDFELEYEEGIDKSRSLLANKLCFSKNQNRNYTAKQE